MTEGRAWPIRDSTSGGSEFLVTKIVIRNFIPLHPYLDQKEMVSLLRTDRPEMVGLKSGSNLEEMVSPEHLRNPERLE